MEKLSICRICLASDLRMDSIVDTHLQDIYEKLTLTSLETKDIRPVQACYICCARLQNCYQLKMNCLQSEELFTQMITNNELLRPVNLQDLCSTPKLGVTPVVVESFGETMLDGFGFKMQSPEPDSSVQVEVRMQVQDVISQDDVGMTDHIQSDPEDEIPLDILKHEPITVDDGEFNSISTAEDPLQLDNTSQKVSKIKRNSTGAISIQRVYSNNIYKCARCQNVFNSKEILTKHFKTHEIDTKNNKNKNNGHEKKHEKPHQSCNKNKNNGHAKKHEKPQSSSKLKNHLRDNSGENIFQCHLCDKSFQQKGDLNAHLNKHINRRKYVCPICKMTYDFKNILTSHIKKVHNAEKLYKCEVCSKNFKKDSILNRHRLIHTNEKLYKCGTCSKSFINNSDLQKHVREHLNLKVFQSCVCEKSFSDESYLINHSLVHSGEKPHKCDVCKKAFAYKSDIKKYKRVHVVKMYKCCLCSKRLPSKVDLVKHYRLHSAEKPYK